MKMSHSKNKIFLKYNSHKINKDTLLPMVKIILILI